MSYLKNMTLADEVEHFSVACAELAGTAITADTAPKFRQLQADEVKLRKRLDEARKAEKEPHLAASRAVDAEYQPLIAQVQEAVIAITRKLTAFLEAEEAKVRAAAAEAKRKAEEEAQRAAKLAQQAQAADDPFAAFDKVEEARAVEANASALARQAAEPVKVNVAPQDGGRSAGLRIVGWIVEVTDAAALVAHYANRADVIEAARKCAAAEAKASKGEAKIPGVTLKADRRAA